ncbi:helix-turn-helix transcriptional regulator [Verrucomicrobiota bacterium]
MLIAGLPRKNRIQLISELTKDTATPSSSGTPSDRYLRPREAAQFAGLSTKTLERYRRAGLLKAHKINSRVIRYRLSDLNKLLRVEVSVEEVKNDES